MNHNIKDIIWPETPFDLVEHSIIIGYRGSHSHNTYIPNTNLNSIDDIDLINIVIPPKRFYYSPIHSWASTEGINDPWDVVAYEFKKFIGLLTKQNPNVMMLLWLNPEHYLKIDPIGQELINRRDLFSSKECLNTFVGYATSQLHRMTHVAGRGYLGAKRKQLVEKYGYDIKNAGHLIRLLYTGIEFLDTGKLNVFRTHDRDLLIAIKTGHFSLIQINNLAAEAFSKIEEVAKKSPLPKKLDLKSIDKLCIDLLDLRLNNWNSYGWIKEE